MSKLLIIDDDQDICLLLSKFLDKKGFKTSVANKGDEAVERLKKESFDLVLLDYKLPDTNGLDMLQRIKILNPETIVIIITGYSDMKTAISTLKNGAYDYVTKPLYPDEILMTINNALETRKSHTPGQRKAATQAGKDQKTYISGQSRAAELVEKHINLIAPTDMSVIIMGETGTGKEFVANAIHKKSERKDKPFVAIDCGALPKDLAGSELFGHVKGAFTGALNDKTGSFELANGGTLFLDEIGNLSYENQIRLLRVLQERRIKKLGGTKDIAIDVRVIAATNEDLKEAVRAGDFREDIYHRLNEFKIELSPLRERKGDIMLFAKHFMSIANLQLKKNVVEIEAEVQEKLMNYFWHGNLRELQNVMKRAVLLAETGHITMTCLPKEIISPDYFAPSQSATHQTSPSHDTANLKAIADNAEKHAILNVLEKTGYNKTRAAQVLNIDRKTLYNKLKAYDIKL